MEKLFTASKLLDKGNSTECINLARTCSLTGADESVRWQAYRLMSIAYLLAGTTDSARNCVENMLELNPTYIVDPLKDPKEFINLLKKIVVIPKFTLGLVFSVGSNYTYPMVTQSYIVADYTKKYKTKSSIQFGTNLGLYLHPRWKIDIGLFATSKAYNLDYSFTNWKVHISEKLTYLEMPVTINYIFRPTKRLRLFLQGGFFGGYLLYAQNNFESTYTPSKDVYTLNKSNSLSRRNRLNSGLTGGFGLYYKLKRGQLSLVSNYFYSLIAINKKNTLYNYIDQIYNYYYVDDDMKLNNATVNIGYSFFLNYKVYRKNPVSVK